MVKITSIVSLIILVLLAATGILGPYLIAQSTWYVVGLIIFVLVTGSLTEDFKDFNKIKPAK